MGLSGVVFNEVQLLACHCQLDHVGNSIHICLSCGMALVLTVSNRPEDLDKGILSPPSICHVYGDSFIAYPTTSQ